MRRVIYCLFALISLIRCSNFEVIDGIAFRQYASAVIDFSTQYSATSWSANRALGKENVFPNYGDFSNAWASDLPDDTLREYLVLGFDTVQTVKIVEIYETYNPGAIDTVFLRNSTTGEWEKVYSKPAVELAKEARKFTFFLPLETTYLVDAIRIAINSSAVPTWNEIDAVAITGQRSKQE